MKRFITVTLLLSVNFSILKAQTEYSVSDVYRVVHSYRLDNTYNEAFLPYKGELPKLLMEAARSGLISPYTFNNQISTLTSFDEVLTKMILEEEFYEEDPWGDGWDEWGYNFWDETFSYFEGDIVDYDGITYVSLMDENEGF